MHKGKAGKQKDQAKEESDDEDEEEKLMKVDDETQKNKRLEKKRRLKERFDTEYDDGDATYFDDLKEEMQKQAEVRGYGVIGKRLLWQEAEVSGPLRVLQKCLLCPFLMWGLESGGRNSGKGGCRDWTPVGSFIHVPEDLSLNHGLHDISVLDQVFSFRISIGLLEFQFQKMQEWQHGSFLPHSTSISWADPNVKVREITPIDENII